MASHQFEFISLQRPLVTKPVNWELCFVCQENNDSSNLVHIGNLVSAHCEVPNFSKYFMKKDSTW